MPVLRDCLNCGLVLVEDESDMVSVTVDGAPCMTCPDCDGEVTADV